MYGEPRAGKLVLRNSHQCCELATKSLAICEKMRIETYVLKEDPEDAMTSLDLLSDDLIEPESERSMGFFELTLRVNTGLHNAHALRRRYKHRAHLPGPDLRLSLRREYAPIWP
jgi:hypothetical protein